MHEDVESTNETNQRPLTVCTYPEVSLLFLSNNNITIFVHSKCFYHVKHPTLSSTSMHSFSYWVVLSPWLPVQYLSDSAPFWNSPFCYWERSSILTLSKWHSILFMSGNKSRSNSPGKHLWGKKKPIKTVESVTPWCLLYNISSVCFSSLDLTAWEEKASQFC